MYYSENKEKAGEYLRLTLSYLTSYRLPATPVNYTVWYEYVAGNNQNLTRAIDYFIKNSKPLNVSVLQNLYQTYISDGDRIFTKKILKEVKGMLADISNYVMGLQVDLAGPGGKLESLSQKLQKADDFDSITAIVDQMLIEAKSLVKSGTDLSGNMTSTSKELKILQKKLEQSREDAETDALTGLINRRGFEKRLCKEIKNAVHTRKRLSLIMVDLDHFKRVNDTFGHLVGDNVLKTLAKILKTQLKGKDSPARFGGEEFILLLPDTRLEDAAKVAENIRKNLASREWKQKDSGKSLGKITLSLGVAQYRIGEAEDSIIARADKSLYLAKSQGRNQVKTEKDLV